MPLFDFRCDKCNLVEEHLVSSDEKVQCSTCKEEMERQFPTTMDFSLKGDWYKTTRRY